MIRMGAWTPIRREALGGRGVWALLAALIALYPSCGTSKSTSGTDAGATDVGVLDLLISEVGNEAASPDSSGDATGPGGILSRCRFDESAATARAVLAVSVDGVVVLVMSDGTTREVYRFTAARPAAGTSFWIRLQPIGEDIFAIGTWWGTFDPAIPCALVDGRLACPETDRWVRITRSGEVIGDITQRSIRSSANIGSTMPPDADAGMPGLSAPVAPTPADPASVTWIFPPGLSPMSRAIDSQGWFISVLRDDYAAWVYRSPDAMSDWTRLGASMGQVEEVQVSNIAGTYLVSARGTLSFFVPTQIWRDDAPPGREPDLLQNSVQLVRPETGVVDVIPYGDDISVNLSMDGLCAVNWEPTPTGRLLTIYDLTINGAKRAFLSETIGIGRPNSLWWQDSSAS